MSVCFCRLGVAHVFRGAVHKTKYGFVIVSRVGVIIASFSIT